MMTATQHFVASLNAAERSAWDEHQRRADADRRKEEEWAEEDPAEAADLQAFRDQRATA